MMSGNNQKTILLVEDEVFSAMAGKIALENCGNKVMIACSGEEAVETVGKNPAIDLVLMDISLGAGIDGTEAAEIILKNHDLPVVFLSGHTEAEVVGRTEKITSYGYIVKSPSSNVLDASIKMAFKLFEAKTKEKEKESQREAALEALRAALEALRESEARYWMLFSGAADGILVADSKTRQFRYANPAICRMLGYTEEEFLRISVADIHPRESLEQVLAEFESLAKGETESTPDLPCLRKDGTVFYATISHSAMVLEGRDYHAGFFHDVTERKQAESQREVALEAVRKSEEKYRSLTENINLGIFRNTIGTEGKFIEANPAIIGMFGYESKEDFLAMNVSGLYQNPEDRSKFNTKMLKQGFVRGEELRLKKKDGNFFIGSVSAVGVEDERGQVKYYDGIIENITERKRSQEELKKSSQLLWDTGEMASVGGWELDLSTKELLWTEEVCCIHGVEPGYKPTLEEAISFYAPEHRGAIEKVLKKTAETGAPFDLEVLFIPRGSKDKIWVRSLGKAVRSDGKITKLAGTFQNIDKYKRVEAALGESEVRFRELFNRMSSGVAVYEAVDDGGDFVIRDFNPAAEKIEQVSSKDIIGRLVSEAFPGVKAFGVFKVFQRVWQTGEAEYYPENIYKNEKNSGSWQESWRENWVFKLPAGEIVSIYNDISERKQAGEEIKRQLAEKEILLKEVHHRIKNNIASIGGLLTLQAQAATNPEAIAVLQDAIGRVNSMRILYDKLLLSEGYKDISVKNYVESLVASVVALFPENAKVTLDQRIDDFKLDPKQLSPLGIIINELLTNIMKHAFTNRDTGLIQISLTNVDKYVTLTIQDDGNGLPAGFDLNESQGFGLMLVKMLSQQLGGSFSIKMHEGTLCRVEFDII